MKVNKISVLLLTLLLGIASVFHSTLPVVSSDTVDSPSITLNYYHYDTLDYCMRASDVELSLSDVLAMDDDQLKREIIKQSDPMMLYRRYDLEMAFWPRYHVKSSDLDISQLKREPSQAGTPVIYTLPSVTEGVVSQLQFLVYVIDDTTPDDSSSSTESSSSADSSSSTASSTSTESSSSPDSSFSTDSSTSTESSSSPDSSFSTDSSTSTESSSSESDSGLVRPELSTSSSSDSGNLVVGKATTSSSSSSYNRTQSQPRSKVASNDKASRHQSNPELGTPSSEEAAVTNSNNNDSKEPQTKNVAKKIATVSLGVVNSLTAIAIVSDIRVVLWYRKLKR